MTSKYYSPSGPQTNLIYDPSDPYDDLYGYYNNKYTNAYQSNLYSPEPSYEIEDFDSSSTEAETSYLTNEHPPAPSVYYTPVAYQTINYLVQQSDLEIGWLGLVEKTKDNNYLIYDIIVPEQEVSGAETDITPETLATTVAQLIAEGKDPNHLRYWGHSHVNMMPHPSQQDENEFQEFLDPAQIPDFFIRGIYNKRGNYKVDIADIADNRLYQCVQGNLQVEAMEKSKTKELDNIMKKNVTKQKIKVTFKAKNNVRRKN